MSSVAISLPRVKKSRTVNWGRFALVGLGTVVAAVVTNVLVYVAGDALVGYDPQFLPLADVSGTILFTLVPAIVAALLYAALRRWTGNPTRVFSNVAVAVFVLTLIPVFTYIPTVPGANAEQTAILVLMHLVAAGVIVGTLTSQYRPQPR